MRFPRTYLVVILVLMSSPSLAFAQFIAGNSSTVNFNSCARPQSGCPETCDLPTDGSAPDSYFASRMPQELGDPGHEGRLHANLRAAARVANPLTCSLRLSAIHFGLQEDTLGRAFADLSVTGRRAFAQFRGSLPQQAYCDALPTQVPAAGCPGPATQSRPSDAELIAGCRRALERAYSVANFLRTGQSLQTNPAKEANRTSLGWIAVSGEDDQPHRPVNVPSSDFPQHDVTVVVPAPLAVQPNRPTVTVSSRFIIAQSLAPPPVVEKRVVIPTDRTERVFNPRFAQAEWTLRAEPPPRIEPNAEILIFVHGMDSRAEEATDLIKALFSRRVPSIPRNLVVIAVDLPSSGYADNLDYGVVSPLSAIGTPDGLVDFRATGETPLLDFIENFVVRFVDNLEDTVPGGVKGRIGAVIGGSLGGNISFRLGRRTDLPWLPAVVAWSPASIWNSKGEGANLIDHQVARRPWESANDRDSADPNDLGPARITRRRDFFQSWDVPILSIPQYPFPPIPLVPAQSEQWSSNWWPCKRSAVAIARLERHETYDPRFLSWRWRLAAEQMLYSHQSRDAATGLPRYRSNRTRMLLACGADDDFPGTKICPKTQATAADMTTTPGKAIFLNKTGHSIHNERRDFFADEVSDFLGLGGRAGSNEDWTRGPYWGSRGTFFADVTGDGLADAIVVNDTVTVRRSTGAGFSANEDWTHGPYFGSRGTFFADVTGDGWADAIVVNNDTVTVRRSTGAGFGANEDWTRGPYWGSRGTFFADVTGDGWADAIVVNNDTVTVRRSTGAGFGANEDWTRGPYFGSRGTFFADVTGDGWADAIAVNNDTVTVRRSTGAGFSANEDWTRGPYLGSRGTFFADVTGDGWADAIVVNNDTVTVRRSTRSAFSPNEDWTGGPYYGSRGIFFADVTGGGAADAIVINNDTVTVRRSR